jgi:hypothetical protein
MAQKSEPNMYVPYYYVHITLSRYKNQISHNIQEIFARLQIAKSAQPIAVHGQNFPCCIRTYVHTYGVKHSPEGFLRFGSNIFFFFLVKHIFEVSKWSVISKFAGFPLVLGFFILSLIFFRIKTRGANPTTTIYSGSVVKIYNANNSIARF